MKHLEIIPLSVGEKSMLHGGFLPLDKDVVTTTTQGPIVKQNNNCSSANAQSNGNCGCSLC